jgi:hypothetical protein
MPGAVIAFHFRILRAQTKEGSVGIYHSHYTLTALIQVMLRDLYWMPVAFFEFPGLVALGRT